MKLNDPQNGCVYVYDKLLAAKHCHGAFRVEIVPNSVSSIGPSTDCWNINCSFDVGLLHPRTWCGLMLWHAEDRIHLPPGMVRSVGQVLLGELTHLNALTLQ
jgi:hypothetical protein